VISSIPWIQLTQGQQICLITTDPEHDLSGAALVVDLVPTSRSCPGALGWTATARRVPSP
jgi:hypothetical protein